VRRVFKAALSLSTATLLFVSVAPAQSNGVMKLDHTKWRLTGVSHLTIPSAVKFTVTFMGSQYLFSGCNQIVGRFQIVDDKLVATGQARTTMKACVRAVQDVDIAFDKTRQEKPAIHLDGDQLLLVEDSGVQWTFKKDLLPSKEAATKFIYVAATTKDCQGVAAKQCLQIREAKDQPWTLNYTDIVGFEYVPGIEYRLRIKEDRVAHPAADAPSVIWFLDVVVEQTVVDRKAADAYEASKKQ
jgi:heat shock protein HslJ